MWMTQKAMQYAFLAAGLTVSSLTLAGASNALVMQDDDDGALEKSEKIEKHKIRVIRAGDGETTIIKKGNRRTIIETRSYDDGIKPQNQAIEKVQAALEEVSKRLTKARSQAERKALEAAQEGLQAAIEALNEGNMHHMVIESSRAGMMGAREELEEALGDVELELDMDGDIRALRLKSLPSGEYSLDEVQEQHLEALRRAEEDIKRERERLEKRLQERKAEAKEKDK